MSAYSEFQEHIAQINDLCCVVNILNWDARTQMPPGGGDTRGKQLSTITMLAQERFTSEKTLRLLETAEAELSSEDPDSYPVRALKRTREAYELASRIPIDILVKRADLAPAAQNAWIEAREESNFSLFQPYLEKMVEFNRQIVEATGYEDHPYNALLNRFEPGMTVAQLLPFFDTLKKGTQPLLEHILSQPQPRTDFLYRDYPEDLQRQFALETAASFGFDLDRGRVDISAHPFEISFTRNDVRITTRYNRNYLPAALFGLLHESGHAIYEQNAAPEITRSALTTDFLDVYAVAGVSYGTHESQSRLWENIVGRSRSFWQHHFGRLQSYFPEQLADVTAEEFYRAVNRVQTSPIRVEADEVTYNFHVMLRVEIEIGLMEKSINVSDLPEIWNAKMKEYLGIVPENDTEGVLQDIHWAQGQFGTFANYTLGNAMSAQFYDAALMDIPGLEDTLGRGEYRPLANWLIENIYRHGRAFLPGELLERATGSALNPKYLLKYLTEKYGDLFPS